jgi:hypothetical protein
MSLRPTRAVVPVVTGANATAPLSNRLHAVLAVSMKSNPDVSTSVDDEPPKPDVEMYFGDDDEYNEPYAKDDPRWGNDIEWVLERIREEPVYFVFVSREYRKREDFAMTLVSQGGIFLNELSPLFKNNREIVKVALKDFPFAYTWISNELKKDDEIIRIAFSGRDGERIFSYLPEDLKQNRDYMRLAVKASFGMFRALPESAKRDRQFVLELLKLNPLVHDNLSETYVDQEFWISAVKENETLVINIPRWTPKTRFFLLKLVQVNGNVLPILIHHQKQWYALFNQVDDETDWGMDIEELENDPEFRMAAATAERNPNMKMMGALLEDIEAEIKSPLLETDTPRDARMERLEGYQTVLQKLAASQHIHPGGPIERKIEELMALLNHPKKSEDLFKYRQMRDMGDILEDEETEPGAKRARVATEARALDAGFRMKRCPVKA